MSIFASCCLNELLGFGNWSYTLNVSFAKRSNGAFNRCPATSVDSIVTIAPAAGKYLVNVPATDADGDAFKCRFASGTGECGSICQSQTQAPFSLTTEARGCVLHYTGTTAPSYNALWPLALVIEDYESASANPMCMMPIQFAVQVSSSNVSSLTNTNCTLYSFLDNFTQALSTAQPITERWWFWLIIALVCLLILLFLLTIALVVAKCVISKKNKRIQQVGQAQEPESEPDTPRPSASNRHDFNAFNDSGQDEPEGGGEQHELDASEREWNWAGVQMEPPEGEGVATAAGWNASKEEPPAASSSASTSAFSPPPPPPTYSTINFDARRDGPVKPLDFNEGNGLSSTQWQQQQNSGGPLGQTVSNEPEIVTREEAI